MDRIVAIVIEMHPETFVYHVRVLKLLGPEHGGRTVTYTTEAGPSIHHAIEVARQIISPKPMATKN